jgi:glycosyltransferase involved in cell wall biosynthesis
MSQAAAEEPWRLLIVVNVAWFFVMHRLPIALMARARGVDVHIACGEGEGTEEIIARGFPFHPLPLTRTPLAPLRDSRALWSLVTLYRRLRPDVVHHVTLKPILYGSIAARIAGIPSVVNAFAGLGYAFGGSAGFARLRRIAIERLLARSLRLPRQSIVFENSDDRRLLIESGAVSAEQSVVISGVGVDTSIYRPTPEPAGPVCVLLASRMLREKGIEYFVSAAERLRSRGSQARFVLVGTPDPFNPGSIDESRLRAWNDSGAVEWRGFESDMPKVLAAAHIVCLPTFYREGVPRILMEGAACARALVATDMPGCRDIVQNGVNGLLVPPHDVDKLAAALELLIDDAVLRVRFGAAGRTLVERRFALPLVLDQFWRIYSGLRETCAYS